MKALFDTHTIQRPNLYRSKTNTLAETWICYTCNILPLYVISKKKRREPWHIPLLLGSLHTFCPVSYPTQRESSQRCGSKIATKKLMIYSSQLEILTEEFFAFAHLLFENNAMLRTAPLISWIYFFCFKQSFNPANNFQFTYSGDTLKGPFLLVRWVI